MPVARLRSDVVGPLARCVRDAALGLDVLAGYSPEDVKSMAGVGRRPRAGYTAKLRKDALVGKRIGFMASVGATKCCRQRRTGSMSERSLR